MNELEEWLISLEVPTPLRPVLGSQVWSNFTAALVQMAVVAGLSGLGTFLEQGGPPEFYARTYPLYSGIILSLGLDHVYSSPLFLALLVWLAASIIACTGTTQLPMAKSAQRVNLRSENSVRRAGQFLIKVDCHDGAAPDNGGAAEAEGGRIATTATRLCSFKTALERRGFVVRTDDGSSPSRLAATRGLVGKFAPMLVHLSLLLVLGGGAAGLIFGASSEVLIGDGGYADMGRVLDKGRRAKGPLYDYLNPFKGLMDTTNLRVKDFRIDYRPDGEIDQFYSKLAVEDARTKEQLVGDEIYVNKPLRYGGATVYQADWGIDRLQLYLNGKPIVVPMKALPEERTRPRGWGGFLPKEFVEAKDPSLIKKIARPTEGIVLIVENMRNVQVYAIDKTLVGVLRSPEAVIDKKMEGMPIQFGEAITVEGSELKLDRIVGQTGLIVKSDPGVPLVYLGFAILMPATLLSVLPFVQVWAAVGEKDPEQIVISGKANRNQPAFEDEMKAMIVSGAL